MSPPDLLPVKASFLAVELSSVPGTRFHRLMARLFDTHVDDLTEDRIDALERQLDAWRATHADGSPLVTAGAVRERRDG